MGGASRNGDGRLNFSLRDGASVRRGDLVGTFVSACVFRFRIGAGHQSLVLAQYLTTAPDDDLENNLSMLPDA